MKKKSSITSKLRNAFIAGIVVLVPIGFTLYLTLFLIRISGKIIPKEINPNNYLPFDIPGVEILMALIIITFTGWLSLSFLGRKFFEFFNIKSQIFFSTIMGVSCLRNYKFFNIFI